MINGDGGGEAKLRPSLLQNHTELRQLNGLVHGLLLLRIWIAWSARGWEAICYEPCNSLPRSAATWLASIWLSRLAQRRQRGHMLY